MMATTGPDSNEFILEVQHVRLHPALEALSGIRTETRSDPEWAMLIPALVAVEVLSPQDAGERGESENSQTLLFGHEVLLAAKENGRPTVHALHAKIPIGMSTAEYVLRQLLNRGNLSVGQRALVAAMLKRLLLKKGRQATASPDASAEDVNRQAGVEAARAGGVSRGMVIEAEELLHCAPDLAQKVLRGECELHVASAILCRRQQKACEPSKAARLQRRLEELLQLLGGAGDDLEGHQDRIVDLVRELQLSLQDQDGGNATAGCPATGAQQSSGAPDVRQHPACDMQDAVLRDGDEA